MSIMSMRALALAGSALAVLVQNTPSNAQTAEELSAGYRRDAMEQALQTKEQYDLYGLHFDSDKATLRPTSKQLLDDIATALKNFPDWRVRIVGHTDAMGDPGSNERLSLERANAVKTALVERGVDQQRLQTAGLGESHPKASNDAPAGRALNRRVELVRFSDSAEARRMVKTMTDFLAAQNALSFGYDGVLEVVTTADQKLGLASSGSTTLNRPNKVHTSRSGGFIDSEVVFDGRTLTVLGKNANLYAQVEAPGTVDQLIDELKDKLGKPMPAADLLMTTAYDELMRDVYDAKDLGSGVVNGVECDTVAFRKDDVDFQIWIAQGDRPYPCRFTVTSKLTSNAPQYTVQFRDWKFGAAVPPDDFAFKNTTGAKQADLKDIREKLGDLPEHFKTRSGK